MCILGYSNRDSLIWEFVNKVIGLRFDSSEFYFTIKTISEV